MTATNTTTTTLHYTTLHYINYITLHYATTATTTTVHYPTLQLQLHYFTLQYTRLHYTIPRYSTQHYSTLQYTTLIAPHHGYSCNCNYTTLITLHYNYNLQTTTTTTPALHHTASSSCGWGDHCNHCNHSRKHNSNHLSVHQWIRSAIRESQQPNLPIGFLFLKLPPPPCAVLLVLFGGTTTINQPGFINPRLTLTMIDLPGPIPSMAYINCMFFETKKVLRSSVQAGVAWDTSSLNCHLKLLAIQLSVYSSNILSLGIQLSYWQQLWLEFLRIPTSKRRFFTASRARSGIPTDHGAGRFQGENPHEIILSWKNGDQHECG